MKKLSLIMAILLVISFSVFAIASTEDSDSGDQGSGAASTSKEANDTIGDYKVTIDSCRTAKDWEGKKVVIVKYTFTNVKDENPAAFYIAFEDAVYQDGVGLNKSYILDDSAKYNADNQTKKIKKGASIEVEVAYELNDTETDIEVEVKELFSFNDKTLKKTFKIKK